ncbi:GNAT superfamily N-acetyltransferase [Kribbella aluminosa]|uniref:GNAT superfamily N-acetyltransferase n=1 Tax=Kribbella aluminosa TaxID=416017 RepID=A0ABS4UVC0_9ACTN|nr:GNAT family N-acetyltransferase [Kribbella aluminosa]MBP2355583.1 GNAT superfamily N-acetyltransferase [Kribbella aluminosa]
MRIESYAESAVPEALRRQVHALQNQAWPGDPTDGPVHDPALRPLSMLLVDDGVVVAALDILRKELRHAGNTFQAGGLSTVVTRADLRGQGHGHRLVTAARTTMIDEHLDLGIFTCDRPLLPFYESAGWHHLPGTTLIGGTPNDPFPSDQPAFDKVALGAFFSPDAQQAAPSFDNARIPLHPGTIDKLW